MTYTFEQIERIVLDNPNKSNLDFGREKADKLRLHLHGEGMDKAIKHCEYFANKDIYEVQKKYAISNKDLFARLLQQEDMVFSPGATNDGSVNFGLTAEQEVEMRAKIMDVHNGMNLRKWVQNSALKAYRSDPMGVIFMEVEPVTVNGDGQLTEPKVYPTYKSTYCIHDYSSKGRRLEYICFRLKVAEAIAFGITDDELKGPVQPGSDSNFFRFVDDAKDLIVKRSSDKVLLVTTISQQNPLPNKWGRVPGFVVSDLVKFDDPRCFMSPLDVVVELADCFLYDRSVRDLQKKYHGFAKAVEPLLACPTCDGVGLKESHPCPDCSKPGDVKGSGFKFRTKVSDVAKFPLEILETVPGFDFNKLFGYATPDIDGWEKQDASLEDLEQLMEMSYWGTVRMRRPKPGKDAGNGEAITATESDSNEAPKISRLNMTADWAEQTETLTATFIAQYWFESFKKCSIIYGRDYVLKTPEKLQDIYQTLLAKGAPDSALDNAYRKWKKAEFQNNPTDLAIELNKFLVEPFPHVSITNAKAVITEFTDYSCKLYFGEWSNTIPDILWATKKPVVLREELKAYVQAKGLKEPEPEKPVAA